ncbi:MAG: lysophospholipid acyltransferase family protein [Deltaproteobacteria bacterium]|nr:lysophospholipid acyltransferase family protein [Deltaproteobacteria bacterium]
MTMTIHETIVIRTLVRWLALLVFKCTGWKTEGRTPDFPRYVIIAAPHTSNWDFIFTLCLAFIYRLNAVIMMKDAWFRWPLGPLFRWLGALPIDRSRANQVVAQSIAKFQQRDRLVLVVPPSGTRKRVLYWKTGFYHIANGAGVPIVLGFLDYRRKVGGFGPSVRPTGDIDADMAVVRAFYRDISGKYPLKESRQCIAPRVSPPVVG